MSGVVGKMVPSCLLWCFWRERNDRSLENHERLSVKLESFFFFTLFTYNCIFFPLSYLSVFFLFSIYLRILM